MMASPEDRAIARLAPRGRSGPATVPRRLGAGLPLALVVVVIRPVVGLAAVGLVVLVPWWCRRRASAARSRAIAQAAPAFVDLVRLGLDAGQPVRQALAAAVEHMPGPLGDRIALALAHAQQGGCLADELAAARELGEPVRPLLDVLERSERYGIPTTDVLARLADEGRRQLRRRAEESARRTPILLLFPLVCCTLPAFVLVTVVPVLVSTLSAISG